jgi:pimeloyl-ACP methyl ester carboxylesterase
MTILDAVAFARALAAALARREIAADAARCRLRFALVAHGHAPTTLWEGSSVGVLLEADADDWSRVFARMPEPGFHSLGALRRRCPRFVLHGDELGYAQVLPFAERLVAAIRDALHGTPSAPAIDRSGLARLEGRYVPLALDGRTDWVYAETTGPEDAPSLVLLHTAGADARQWHGLMANDALASRWRMHAFDLPGHGRSPLPAAEPNWTWRLTEDAYRAWVLAYLDAVGIDRAALVGCSMGSAIGLVLLARDPQRFAGALLLEPPYRSPGRRSPYLHHPEVHGGRLSAAWVGSLLSPSSPAARRDEATWIYSQGAPGVYDGDLAFYSDDFDAAAHTPQVDTAASALWLATGDYDYSATVDDARRIVAEVRGARFIALPGFGHFPMVEDPDRLVPLLTPAFDDLHRRFEEHS